MELIKNNKIEPNSVDTIQKRNEIFVNLKADLFNIGLDLTGEDSKRFYTKWRQLSIEDLHKMIKFKNKYL